MGLAVIVYFSAGAATDPEGSITGGIVGTLAVFIGVILAMPALISPVLKAIAAALTKWLGILGRLTALNLLRAPTRSGNTTVMILVGTSLIIAIGSLSSSSSATSDYIVNHQVRFDLGITADGPPVGVAPQLLSKVRRIPGVKGVTGFTLATPGTSIGQDKPMLDQYGEPIILAGIDPVDFRQASGFFSEMKKRAGGSTRPRKDLGEAWPAKAFLSIPLGPRSGI